MMTRTIRNALLLSTALTFGLATAHAGTVTFDAIGPTGNADQNGTVTTQGFNFTSASFHIVDDPTACAGGCVDDGSEYLAGIANFDSPVVVTSASGLPFSLTALNAAKLFLTPGGLFGSPNADTLNLTGTLAAGGTLAKSLTLPIEGVFSTFTLAGFSNLSSLTIAGSMAGGGDGSWAVDNLAVTATAAAPEPAMLVPVSLALLLAFARSRRRS